MLVWEFVTLCVIAAQVAKMSFGYPSNCLATCEPKRSLPCCEWQGVEVFFPRLPVQCNLHFSGRRGSLNPFCVSLVPVVVVMTVMMILVCFSLLMWPFFKFFQLEQYFQRLKNPKLRVRPLLLTSFFSDWEGATRNYNQRKMS
uniref:Secreted protein n=1 Tax=Ixodes ricinus TaxID=34613 RepID=A0A147BNU4_IXORI